MKRFGCRAIVAGFFLMAAGCSNVYVKTGPPALPDHIHKIAVRPFTNHTQQFGLEDKLTLAVQSELVRDGRYQITTEDQADGVLIGDIAKYILEAMSYDVNHVPTEYKLTIPVDVSFLDKVTQKTLWTEPGMIGELRYFVASSGFAGSMTEAQAQQTIWDQLSRDIAHRTLIAGYGAQGGSSSARKESENRHVAPLDDNPPPVPNPEPRVPMRQPY